MLVRRLPQDQGFELVRDKRLQKYRRRAVEFWASNVVQESVLHFCSSLLLGVCNTASRFGCYGRD